MHGAIGYGCLISLLWSGVPAAASVGEPSDVSRVATRVFQLDYGVNEAAQPLEAVELWYTLDRGATWQQYGLDEDRQSPITFHAPCEGLYGFVVVAANSVGASSQTPTGLTEPHLWAFVDYTPPVVQLHALRQTSMLGQPIVQIRWTAVDNNFPARPIQISYQRLPDATWRPITPESVANTGRFDWRIPEGLTGPVAVRLTVTDCGDHRVDAVPEVIEVSPIKVEESAPTPPPGGLSSQREVSAKGPSIRAAERVDRLVAEAAGHRDLGEYRQAVARLREAVQLAPQRTDAFAEMGSVLYRIGDLDGALGAYDIALKQQPAMRTALHGSAMVLRQRGDHAGAAQRLRTILRYNPADAESWMNLGDVAVFQGDEVLARECYTRATEIDPGASQTIADARKRLALMTEVSRSYVKASP